MTTRSSAGQRGTEPATPPPPAIGNDRARPAPAESFLARLGMGDSRVGAWMTALLAATALLYSRALSFEFVLDDLDWIGNRFVGNWPFIWKSFGHDAWWYLDPKHLPQSSYYRPLLDDWTALNFHLFGFNPIGWHAAMIVLYLIVVWLVFRIATLLTADTWTGLLAAALFALMPTHAESVVWASTICQPLLAGFELGAFELYIRRTALAPADPRRARWLLFSLALFAGALLSYESAVLFPVIVASHAFLLRPDRSYRTYKSHIFGVRRAIRAALPYALAVVPYLAVRFMVLGFITRPEMHDPLTPLEAALTIPGAIVLYLSFLAMPWRAGPEHQVNIVHSAAAPGFYLPLVELAALGVVGWYLLRRHPHRRLYLFCAGWFLLTLAPMLNLRGLFSESLVHDRYLYFPAFGFCLMAADLAMAYGRRGAGNMNAVRFGAAAVMAVYAVLLFHVEPYWHDNLTLFRRCIEQSPNVPIWHNRLGMWFKAHDRYAEARQELEATVKLKRDAGGDIYYELGVVDERLDDPRAAEQMMAEGIKRVAHPPLAAYTDLAIAAAMAGDADGAAAALKRAETMPGGIDAAAIARAQIMRLHGDSAGAERMLRDFLSREPDKVTALTALGMTLSDEHRYDEALAAYGRASAIAPKDAKLHYFMALMLHRLGRDQAARRECQIAISNTTDNAGMIALLAEIGRGKPAN